MSSIAWGPGACVEEKAAIALGAGAFAMHGEVALGLDGIEGQVVLRLSKAARREFAREVLRVMRERGMIRP